MRNRHGTPIWYELMTRDPLAARRFYAAVAGWHIDEASNGIEALERVLAQDADRAFDLYVVDVNMPRLDGYSFVRELRRLGEDHQAPVLMVSTEAQRRDAA